ncbi:MAG: hypothetical protein AAFQ66_15775 [Pseudomonadota bacterium]
MLGADFVWLNFDHTFNGVDSETRGFRIDEEPDTAAPNTQNISAEGYLLIQAQNVGNDATRADDGNAAQHRILINGTDLPAFDLVNANGLNLWMDRIPDGVLRRGDNRLTIRSVGSDNFRVLNVVVQWRERRGTASIVGSNDLEAVS